MNLIIFAVQYAYMHISICVHTHIYIYACLRVDCFLFSNEDWKSP